LLGRGEDHTQGFPPIELEELQRHQRVTDRPESICRDKQDTRFERSGQVQRVVLPGERRQKASSAFDQCEVGAGGDSAASSAQCPSQGAAGPRLAHAGVRADDQ